MKHFLTVNRLVTFIFGNITMLLDIVKIVNADICSFGTSLWLIIILEIAVLQKVTSPNFL